MSSLTLKQFIEYNNLVATTKHRFSTLGLKIVDSLFGGFAYTMDMPNYIREAINSDYPFGMPAKEEIMLALALTQEHRNNFLDVEDIEFVNAFFGYDLTIKSITDFGHKYI